MAGKHITIKDVAKQAGVSVATVSYVMNNRTDVKITDETRKKVLQVANLLNYSPNQAAKALASNRKNTAAILMPETDSILKHADYMYTLQLLAHFFYKKHFDLLLLDPATYDKYDETDAIICYDLSSAQFHELGDKNFVPLIALDCIINDPLFFQVNTNPEIYKAASSQFDDEPFKYIFLTSDNLEKTDFLINSLGKENICFIRNVNELDDLDCHNIVTDSHSISKIAGRKHNICLVPSMTEKKENILLSCIEDALNRVQITSHNVLVK